MSTVIASPLGTHSVATAARRGLSRAHTLLIAATLLVAALIATSTSFAQAASNQRHLGAGITRNYARQMLALLNAERVAHGRTPLTLNTKLITSAHEHNLAMASHDEMAHQLPGEAFFADRISRTGYDWKAAGENIGWNSDLSRHGVMYLERVMYHEKAPDNGHRQNILSTEFTQVGIDVYYDATHNKIWFTQDFGLPA